MADYTDAEFSDLLNQLAQLPVEDRTSDLLKLLKTLLTKNVTVQDWNTLIRDIAPLYATMLGLNDCMVDLINKVRQELEIVTGSPSSSIKRIDALEKECTRLDGAKFNRTGGEIDGSVDISGNLTVRGKTSTVDTAHLRVKDAVIETNVDAETADDIPDLSGYVIHIGNGAAYGIVYDKNTQSVKLGLVEKVDGKYRFQNNEGQAVALRADTGDLIAGRLVVWNRDTNRFETKFQVAQDATRMTIVQRNTDGEVITAAKPKSDGAAVPKKLFDTKVDALTEGLNGKLNVHPGDADGNYPFYPAIPMIARVSSSDKTHYKQMWEQLSVEAINKSIPQRTAYGTVQTKDPQAATDSVNLQYANEHYVAKKTTTTANRTFIYAYDSTGDKQFGMRMEADAHTVPFRGTDGTLKVGTAVEDSDAMPKKQVEDGFVAKVTTTSGSNLAYIAKNDGTQSTIPIAQMPYQNTVAQRGAGGTLKVGTPVGDDDATPKKFVEDGFIAKVTTGNKNQAYTVDTNNQQAMMGIDESATAWTLARRYTAGRLKVGNPADPKDAVNLGYLVAQLDAVTGAAPYFMHNVCITQTVDNVVNTIRVSLVCTQLARITSVAALRALIVQLNGGGDASDANTPVWHGACNMAPYNPSEGVPDSMLVYSGYIGLWNGTTLKAWGDTIYPSAAHNVTLDDTNWTVSDDVLNAVVGGTTA